MNTLEIILIVLAIWAIPWKLYAVWTAAKLDQRIWFLVLLFVNTFAILEIFYVFFVLKKNWAEVKQDWKDGWRAFKAEFTRKKKVEENTPSSEVGSNLN